VPLALLLLAPLPVFGAAVALIYFRFPAGPVPGTLDHSGDRGVHVLARRSARTCACGRFTTFTRTGRICFGT